MNNRFKYCAFFILTTLSLSANAESGFSLDRAWKFTKDVSKDIADYTVEASESAFKKSKKMYREGQGVSKDWYKKGQSKMMEKYENGREYVDEKWHNTE